MSEPKSKTSIAFERVGCYRINGHILTSVSKWNGLEELRDEKGRKLIVWMPGGAGFSGLFETLFGQAPDGVLEPIVGDLELMAELRQIKEDHDTTNPIQGRAGSGQAGATDHRCNGRADHARIPAPGAVRGA